MNNTADNTGFSISRFYSDELQKITFFKIRMKQSSAESLACKVSKMPSERK